MLFRPTNFVFFLFNFHPYRVKQQESERMNVIPIVALKNDTNVNGDENFTRVPRNWRISFLPTTTKTFKKKNTTKIESQKQHWTTIPENSPSVEFFLHFNVFLCNVRKTIWKITQCLCDSLLFLCRISGCFIYVCVYVWWNIPGPNLNSKLVNGPFLRSEINNCIK